MVLAWWLLDLHFYCFLLLLSHHRLRVLTNTHALQLQLSVLDAGPRLRLDISLLLWSTDFGAVGWRYDHSTIILPASSLRARLLDGGLASQRLRAREAMHEAFTGANFLMNVFNVTVP